MFRCQRHVSMKQVKAEAEKLDLLSAVNFR